MPWADHAGRAYVVGSGGVLPLKDENPTRRTPFITVLLIGACVWVFFSWQPVFSDSVEETALFAIENAAIPCEVLQGRPLTIAEVRGGVCGIGPDSAPTVFPDKSVLLALLTSMFLHGGLLHLGGNLLFLWIFGNNIEDHLGHTRYLIFYLLGGIFASAAHIGLNPDSTIPVVGASGAIAAVMGAYLVWFPDAPVRTVVFFFFITLVDIRAKWLLGFWFVSQFFTSPQSGVAWAAHVGGFVFGVILAYMVRMNKPVRRVTWTRDYQGWGAWDRTGGIGSSPYRTRRFGGGRRRRLR